MQWNSSPNTYYWQSLADPNIITTILHYMKEHNSSAVYTNISCKETQCSSSVLQYIAYYVWLKGTLSLLYKHIDNNYFKRWWPLFLIYLLSTSINRSISSSYWLGNCWWHKNYTTKNVALSHINDNIIAQYLLLYTRFLFIPSSLKQTI